MTGKGSVNHNSRKFHAKNIDSERSYLNVEYCNEDVKDVYHELFDEALVRYNEKQTRSDRKIDDYYDKICFGKQEKPFHDRCATHTACHTSRRSAGQSAADRAAGATRG